jgi:hypothetical protein
MFPVSSPAGHPLPHAVIIVSVQVSDYIDEADARSSSVKNTSGKNNSGGRESGDAGSGGSGGGRGSGKSNRAQHQQAAKALAAADAAAKRDAKLVEMRRQRSQQAEAEELLNANIKRRAR